MTVRLFLDQLGLKPK